VAEVCRRLYRNENRDDCYYYIARYERDGRAARFCATNRFRTVAIFAGRNVRVRSVRFLKTTASLIAVEISNTPFYLYLSGTGSGNT